MVKFIKIIILLINNDIKVDLFRILLHYEVSILI
jgi:hypothetical protein